MIKNYFAGLLRSWSFVGNCHPLHRIEPSFFWLHHRRIAFTIKPISFVFSQFYGSTSFFCGSSFWTWRSPPRCSALRSDWASSNTCARWWWCRQTLNSRKIWTFLKLAWSSCFTCNRLDIRPSFHNYLSALLQIYWLSHPSSSPDHRTALSKMDGCGSSTPNRNAIYCLGWK